MTDHGSAGGLVDTMLDACIDWSEEGQTVTMLYRRWQEASTDDAALTFAAYTPGEIARNALRHLYWVAGRARHDAPPRPASWALVRGVLIVVSWTTSNVDEDHLKPTERRARRRVAETEEKLDMYELPIAAGAVREAMLRNRRPAPDDGTPRPTASRLRRMVAATLRSLG
jgi:hypothetical protein